MTKDEIIQFIEENLGNDSQNCKEEWEGAIKKWGGLHTLDYGQLVRLVNHFRACVKNQPVVAFSDDKTRAESGMVEGFNILNVESPYGYGKQRIPFSEWLQKYNAGEIAWSPVMVEVTTPNDAADHRIWTFCKIWMQWKTEVEQWHCVRLGLGAYGDWTAWREPVTDESALRLAI